MLYNGSPRCDVCSLKISHPEESYQNIRTRGSLLFCGSEAYITATISIGGVGVYNLLVGDTSIK